MKLTRRNFLVASTLTGSELLASSLPKAKETVRPLKILILGGTGFLGPAQVEYARSRSHELTLFNRGKTNPHLFPNIEQLRGDRNDDLEALEGRRWDVVIDNSASIPRWVQQSAQLLKGSVKHYLFVSSLSVYSDNSVPGMDESGTVGKLDDPSVEEITGQTYGPLKALCEEEARRAFPEDHTVVRPGLIVGPRDGSDRFTYWPVRIDRGGEVMGPGDPTDPVQFIDVRDLASWMIHMVERRVGGTYNATGPIRPLSIAEMLYGIRAVTSVDVFFTWVPASFLEEQQVRPWSDMPVWIPPTGEMRGFSRFDCKKALAQGLSFRPLADTARDTLNWFKGLPEERRSHLRSGLKQEREVEVLSLWHARQKA